MIERFFSRVLLLGLSCSLVLALHANPTDAPLSNKSDAAQPAKAQRAPLVPGKYDGSIAWYTASLLERHHYFPRPLDRGMSTNLFDRYVEALDLQHLHFLQSDIDEFSEYRGELGDMIINKRHVADLKPAFEIFSRFLDRLEQRVAYVDELLKTEKFTFDSDERIPNNRKEMPYPKDMAEAKKLWKERLRAEFLQEKINKIEARKKPDTRLQGTKSNKPAKPKSDEEDIADSLSHSYHRSLRNFTDWSNDDVLQVYLATLTHIYDPHSDYMGSPHLES